MADKKINLMGQEVSLTPVTTNPAHQSFKAHQVKETGDYLLLDGDEIHHAYQKGSPEWDNFNSSVQTTTKKK